MVTAILNCFKIEELRRRIIFTLLVLVIVRLGASIPVPGVNADVLGHYFRQVIDTQKQGSVIGLLNIFSGGALENCAIFSLTIMPYISASIVMQLAIGVIPTLGRLAREEGGRQKITQYTRIGTLILCAFQGYMTVRIFENPEANPFLPGIRDTIFTYGPLVPDTGFMFEIPAVITLTAGTMLLMWLGEQITDKGIGNGASLIIAIGIVAKLPSALVQAWNAYITPSAMKSGGGASPVILVVLIVFLLAVIASTIALTQAMRKVTVQYTKQVRGNKVYGGQSSFLPLKVNYAGVMPIIFANAILLMPSMMVSWMLPTTWTAARNFFASMGGGTTHHILMAILTFASSYFWVAMVFNPTQIADDMKRHGGFIPGIRPGEATSSFLDLSMTRLTFAGALFLSVLAVLPGVVHEILKVPPVTAQFFGGTGLLIVVGVVLDTMRQTETFLLQRHYDGFLKKGRLRGRSTAMPSTGNALPEKQILWLIIVICVILIGGIVAITLQKG